MKHLIWLCLILATQSACSGVDEMRWKEQVWLQDGRFITIDRESKRVSSGFPNSRRGPVLSQQIRYAPMNVIWTTKGSSELPISFEIINGDAYLVTVSQEPLAAFCRNRKSGAYLAVVYRWKNGVLKQIDQSELAIANMGNNISGTSQWGYDRSSDRQYISWKDVAYETMQPSSGPPVRLKNVFEPSWLHCA